MAWKKATPLLFAMILVEPAAFVLSPPLQYPRGQQSEHQTPSFSVSLGLALATTDPHQVNILHFRPFSDTTTILVSHQHPEPGCLRLAAILPGAKLLVP